MNIWVIKSGEPLPFDSKAERLLRSSTLAVLLATKPEVKVTYFFDAFDHKRKVNRIVPSEVFNYMGVEYVPLRGIGYRKNVSLRRVLHNYIISLDVLRRAFFVEKPNVIILSFPPIALAFTVALFSRLRRSRLILDLRDMWPDIFVSKSRSFLRWIIVCFHFPLIRFILNSGFRIVGVAPVFKVWANQYSFISHKFTVIPHTYYSTTPYEFCNMGGPTNSDAITRVVYFGALSQQRSLREACKFFTSLKLLDSKLVVHICGYGDEAEDLKAEFESDWLNFPGLIDVNEMNVLASQATIGLAPYLLNENYQENIPNKIIEYLYYDLSILTNIDFKSFSKNISLDGVARSYNNYESFVTAYFSLKSNYLKGRSKRIFDTDLGNEIFLKKYLNIIYDGEC